LGIFFNFVTQNRTQKCMYVVGVLVSGSCWKFLLRLFAPAVILQ